MQLTNIQAYIPKYPKTQKPKSRKTRQTTIRHTMTVMLAVCLHFLVCMSVQAQKLPKGTKPKTHATVISTSIEPDQIARKARPDRHPGQISKPSISHEGNLNGKWGLEGFDISHYQGRIDWDEVAKEPKAGFIYLKATEGPTHRDNTYEYNFSECKRVGLKVGSYHFFRANVSAQAQFENFATFVDRNKQDLLPLIDVETLPKGMSSYALCERLYELCQLIEREYGQRPLIYTGRNFYNRHIYGFQKLRGYKFFIAAYSFEEPNINGDDYLLWQYTDSGRSRGIRGNVDTSRFVRGHTLREIMLR